MRHSLVTTEDRRDMELLKYLLQRTMNEASYKRLDVEIVERPSGFTLMGTADYDSATEISGRLEFALELLKIVNWKYVEEWRE